MLLLCLVLTATACAPARAAESVFFPTALTEQLEANLRRFPEAQAERDRLVAQARSWDRSDEALWGLMFGPSITRSWHVWSDGACPACRKAVPMYTWQMNALAEPWKVRCPHCREAFPKNDFAAFYRSGLFDPRRADRSLLYNTEHPSPADPLHAFGVDDGEGYVEGEHRWRFIGAYLVHGQWKQAIVYGIAALAEAYVITGDPAYAHRAGVLLSRVADLYPSHDFGAQGLAYEKPASAGYVSVWHDACQETRTLAVAYDRVKPALARDEPLAVFLDGQAQRHGLARKRTPADVLAGIDAGLLTHPMDHPERIASNFPETDLTLAILQTVRGAPNDFDAAMERLTGVLVRATAVDGVTGEKGLTSYATFATASIANVLELYARARPGWFEALLAEVPRLPEMFRFPLDLWYRGRFYPRIGDAGTFGVPDTTYIGASLSPRSGVNPSMYSFLGRLHRATGDLEFLHVLWPGGDVTAKLPPDLLTADPRRLENEARASSVVIRRIPSVDKQEWHLAMLRSGVGDHERALWIDYDAGGFHRHADALNVGLFAFGLDLLPDFGYPPVQFGGWEAPAARWYGLTAAHNTVVVDGLSQRNLAGAYPDSAGLHGAPAGRTTLWQIGESISAVRAECPGAYDGLSLYERTLALVSASGDVCYVVDVFRASGGSDHARFYHGPEGALAAHGLHLAPAPDFGHGSLMRAFRTDPSPAPGWRADWTIVDRHHLLSPGPPAHLRLLDLTTGTEASIAESWVAPGGTSSVDSLWLGSVVVRRRGPAPLSSTFVAVLEPYRGAPAIDRATRLPVTGSGETAAVEIQLADRRTDLLILADPRFPGAPLRLDAQDLVTDGDLTWIRRNAEGAIERVALHGARRLQMGDLVVSLRPGSTGVELAIEATRAIVKAGDAQAVESVTWRGRAIL